MPTAVAEEPRTARDPKLKAAEMLSQFRSDWQIELHIAPPTPTGKPEGWQPVDDEC